jgi:hypothetical protein
MIPENGYCRNRQENAGKITVSYRKTPESTGIGSSILVGKFRNFSGDFPIGSWRKVQENHSEFTGKIPENSDRNIASTFRRLPVYFCRFSPYVFDLGF